MNLHPHAVLNRVLWRWYSAAPLYRVYSTNLLHAIGLEEVFFSERKTAGFIPWCGRTCFYSSLQALVALAVLTG